MWKGQGPGFAEAFCDAEHYLRTSGKLTEQQAKPGKKKKKRNAKKKS